MSKDLEIIKQLEKQIGKKIEQVNADEIWQKNSYSIDDRGYVIGLNLANNQISDLTPFQGPLQGLSQLTDLRLFGNKISDVSPLQGLSQLTKLGLNVNQLSDVSPLQGLSQLTTLGLSSNKISDVSPLQGLSQLTVLRLNDNQLSDVSALQGLSQLTELYLHNNQLNDVSPLQGLSQLTTLILYNNQLSDVSPLQGLSQLTTLWLQDNQLSDVSALQGLSQLTELNLNNNQLSDVSPLQGLKHIKTLDVRFNKIQELPEAFIHMGLKIDVDDEGFPFGHGLHLHGNPLVKPPVEITRQGKKAMAAWFRSQKEEEKQALNEVKVVLVGDGGAGKTSLVKQLLGEDFDPHECQTHGIAITSWNIEANSTPIIARIWDFGGQEIMHATHQFFLSERCLYILVLDGRKDEKTEYWLKHIQSFGGDSPVLVVINKIDENPGFDLNRPFLQDKYTHIKAFFRISCKKSKGIPEFSKALAKELSQVEMLRTSWAKSWFNVKTQLEKMPEPYISFQQYKEICDKEKIADSQSREILVKYLNDLGVVLHFEEFDLQDTHVLEPGWATSAVYKIINSDDVVKRCGVLHMNRLATILAPQKPGDYTYPVDKHRYIITLMRKFELCYTIDDHKVLVPDLLPVQEPTYEFDYDNALAFVIQYDFLPRSVMPRFIVNMHNDIKDGLQWRTGVVLEDKEFSSVAVVKADHEAKCIYIYVTGGQRRDYFAVVLSALRRINKSFEKLEIFELVPMPDNPKITANYKQLIQFEEDGVEFYRTGEGDNRYRIKELLGPVSLSDLTREQKLEILKKLVKEEDTPEAAEKKLSDALILQPNLFGIGVDVKDLIRTVLSWFKKKKK